MGTQSDRAAEQEAALPAGENTPLLLKFSLHFFLSVYVINNSLHRIALQKISSIYQRLEENIGGVLNGMSVELSERESFDEKMQAAIDNCNSIDDILKCEMERRSELGHSRKMYLQVEFNCSSTDLLNIASVIG